MPYNLFLDDIRTPVMAYSVLKYGGYLELDWVIVRSYSEFVSHINTHGLPSIVSFDHDLGIDIDNPNLEKSGYNCATWLVNYCLMHGEVLPEYYVHSMNSIGRKNIENAMSDYNRYYDLMHNIKRNSQWNCTYCENVDFHDSNPRDAITDLNTDIIRTCYTCGGPHIIQK